MKTYNATAQTAQHHWYVVDAADKTLGRISTVIASYLRGKHKPEFTPNVDTGDYIVVINAEKVKVTGNKTKDKIYFLLTGELTIMIILGYYLHPVVWFAFYFCILHGIRALINYNFNFFSDMLWLLLFTAPITLIIIYMNLGLSLEGFLIVFPILACLTIAHMLLPKIISFSKTKVI